MKALVAGGAGFIGSHLIDALLAEGHDVVCVDNYFIGTKANIAHLQNNPHFKLYEQDLADFAAVNDIFRAEQVDYVFHLAANSDIQASANDPAIEYHNTYSTTFSLLEAMRLNGVKKLFFASTSAVYGEQMGREVSEDAVALRPISYYGGCKLGSEAAISAYAYMNDLEVLVFRFPNVIGPPADPRCHLRLRQAAEGQSLPSADPGRRYPDQTVYLCAGSGGRHHALQGRRQGCDAVQCGCGDPVLRQAHRGDRL